MTRFLDHGILRSDFMSKPIWVICSFCQKPAQIIDIKKSDSEELETYFCCLNCGKKYNYQENRYKTIQKYQNVIAHIDQKCECKLGRLRYSENFSHKSHVPAFIEIECSICNQITKRSPCISIAQSNRSDSPQWHTIMGHHLYLTVDTRLGKILVCNGEELSCLKDYIQADLRERTYHNISRTYFNRLPAWIKSARHRKEVLKAISKLEQKLNRLEYTV